MAYIFIGEHDTALHGFDYSCFPDKGENAVILQPGGFEPIVEPRPPHEGPSLQRYAVADRIIQPGDPIELGVIETRLTPSEIAVLCPDDPMDREVPEHWPDDTALTWIGGRPFWYQEDDTPEPGEWHLIVQFEDGTLDTNSPFITHPASRPATPFYAAMAKKPSCSYNSDEPAQACTTVQPVSNSKDTSSAHAAGITAVCPNRNSCTPERLETDMHLPSTSITTTGPVPENPSEPGRPRPVFFCPPRTTSIV